MWTIWGTAIDIACLATLAILVRREGIRLLDLVGTSRAQIRRDLLLVIPFLFALLVPAFLIGTPSSSESSIPRQPWRPSSPPSPRALAYGILVWPILWTFTEEISYLGYAFPRLVSCLRNPTQKRWTLARISSALLTGSFAADVETNRRDAVAADAVRHGETSLLAPSRQDSATFLVSAPSRGSPTLAARCRWPSWRCLRLLRSSRASAMSRLIIQAVQAPTA
jgi:hypothetical protein